MAEQPGNPQTTKVDAQAPPPALSSGEAEELVGDQEFGEAYGEQLKRTLDLDTWATGIDWEGAVARLKSEIRDAVTREEKLRRIVQKKLLPLIGKRDGAPSVAGVWATTPEEIAKVHEGLLFPGRVEAVDGTSVSHDTLPLGITQIGIALVSYGGASATFSQRVFRKELAGKSADPVKAALEIIDRRGGKGDGGRKEGTMSELGRRGIMAYAERKVLTDKATSDWRLGHGAPAPYELLTGSGSMRLLEASLEVLARMIAYEKFVFVPRSLAERGLLTIGNALDAGQYAIIGTMDSRMRAIVDGGHYAKQYREEALAFVEAHGSDLLFGLYRASEHSPAQLFYAHRNQVHMAARIAIADSVLRPARGFPMLIDVADTTCKSAFGAAGFMGLIHDAYSQAGVPLRYLSDRETSR